MSLTSDEIESLTACYEENRKCGRPQGARETTRYSRERPVLPVVDGDPCVVELKGRKSTKVHRDEDDVETKDDYGRGIDEPFPWCADGAGGHTFEDHPDNLVYRTLEFAREWRSPCAICFPSGGFPDE